MQTNKQDEFFVRYMTLQDNFFHTWTSTNIDSVKMRYDSRWQVVQRCIVCQICQISKQHDSKVCHVMSCHVRILTQFCHNETD